METVHLSIQTIETRPGIDHSTIYYTFRSQRRSTSFGWNFCNDHCLVLPFENLTSLRIGVRVGDSRFEERMILSH